MFDVPTLLSYLAAALLLVVAPGPGQMLVLARTLTGGRSVGVATALGLGVGSLVPTLAAAFGLSQLLARSAGLYTSSTSARPTWSSWA
jgi:threonine/homoserine/homoserine lactone efflux protein